MGLYLSKITELRTFPAQIGVKTQKSEKLAAKLIEFCFTVLHSSVFGKVRELAGEMHVRYAYGY